MENNSILIVCEEDEIYWHEFIFPFMSSFGTVYFSNEKEILLFLSRHYQLVIVDTESIEHIQELLTLLRSALPYSKIIVLSSIPTWKLARTAFNADVDDYYRKSYDAYEMTNYINLVLDKPSRRISSDQER